MLDIFNDNAFGVVPLTDAINTIPFVPGHIGRMGLFSTTSVSTTTIAVEMKNGVITLVPPTPRGAPGTTVDKSKRSIRSLRIPHFEINDTVMAEEVQGVRAWGSESAVESVMGKVAERMAEHTQSMEVTEEYARLGAVKGVITYADGTTLSLFTELGVSQAAETNFALGTAVDGALRKACAAVYRAIAAALEGVPFSGVTATCGDNFFDALIANPEVRASYLQQQAANELRGGYVGNGQSGSYGSFEFGGIVWENYRGAVGGTSFIETDKCHLFPTGVPGLFKTYYAPADYVETVNTLGKRLYVKQYDMPNGKGVHLDVQSNNLPICTRPAVLLKGKRA